MHEVLYNLVLQYKVCSKKKRYGILLRFVHYADPTLAAPIHRLFGVLNYCVGVVYPESFRVSNPTITITLPSRFSAPPCLQSLFSRI